MEAEAYMNVEALISEIGLKIISALLIIIFGIVLGLVYKGFDRKISAMMQSRIGPPIIQPFRDVRKLLSKETIIPDDSIQLLFNLAPVFALLAPLLALLYIPIGPFDPLLEGYGDIILVLYLMALPPLALAVGGSSSGSPYSVLGAQRKVVLMMSYELPLAISVIAVVWRISKTVGDNLNPFSLRVISSYPIWEQVGLLGSIGIALATIAIIAVIPGELSKEPFGQAEAKTEIAGGALSEYSGRNLAFYYIASSVHMVVIGSLIISILFPYQLTEILYPLIEIDGLQLPYLEMSLLAILVDIVFFLFKLMIIIYVGVSILGVSFARLQINKASYVYWIPLSIMAFIGLILVFLEYSLF